MSIFALLIRLAVMYSLRSELIDSDLVQIVLNLSQLIQNRGSKSLDDEVTNIYHPLPTTMFVLEDRSKQFMNLPNRTGAK